MTTQQYIDAINQRFKLGNATEHTFRGDLQQLIESLAPQIRATNEPKRQSCGAPDYILTKKDIPIGFIEAKDIGDPDLEGAKKTGNKEQFDRYKASLSNIIFTDYITFHLYRDALPIAKISIAELIFPSSGGVAESRGGSFPSSGGVSEGRGGRIKPLPENFATFENLIKDFCTYIGRTIKSPKKLAEMMAAKARLLSEVIEKALNSDEDNQQDSTLKDQMLAFRQILIHDITPKGFADVYAQTIAYGMFAARLHDPSLDDFTRQEAAELIPKTNPFLRKLFSYIAGPDIDDRIKWIVDSLVEIFLASNVAEILSTYGKQTQTEDPIIHFYETFLSEYDPALRKARGVWYTPAPVVNFIVRAVDDILKTEFDMPQGLADNSKTKIKVNLQGKTVEKEVHKVQILDPATGTGTFLAEVVKHIHKKFAGQQGIWSNYVETHLLPRLNGFELLMASYAMAHLKLDLLLTETGYKPTQFPSSGGVPEGRGGRRLRVYLTNSLEESHPDTGTLFANWLSTEANEANHIKRDTPVMVVMGNPPYSISTTNKGKWIENLIADYKKDLNERKINLDDDYIKFIRYGQHFIDKNGSGVLAYISNNSFIDGITHRQMRKHLLQSFDKIYILNLHGNSRIKEICADGSPDQNVFDIMQGVSVNIFIKTDKKKKDDLGQLFHFDLQGKREFKYNMLTDNTINSVCWNELEYKYPNLFFVPKDFDELKIYETGFKLNSLFEISNSGIKTDRDSLFIDFSKDILKERIIILLEKNYDNIFIQDFNVKNSGSYKLLQSIENRNFSDEYILPLQYRPFDNRWIYYDTKIISRPASKAMLHLIHKENFSLSLKRQSKFDFSYSFIHRSICESCLFESAYANNTEFPLYLYSNTSAQQSIDQNSPPLEGCPQGGVAPNESPQIHAIRTPNLNPTILKKIADGLGLTFVPEKNSPPLEGCPTGGVVPSPPLEGCPTGGVVPILTTINNIPIRRNFIENLPHNPSLDQRAKDKRKAGILSEVLFWQQVHQGLFHKIDFDRQKIIGNYIVDFYVKALGLIIEIDGSSHSEKEEYDANRQAYLESLGLKIFRASDYDVKQNLSNVMMVLEDFIIKEYGELTTPAFSHPSTGGEYSLFQRGARRAGCSPQSTFSITSMPSSTAQPIAKNTKNSSKSISPAFPIQKTKPPSGNS